MAIIREVKERPREIMPGNTVGRVLPAPPLMRVGPFVFLDHGGPHDFGPGEGSDVPPHPHIGLATVTYVLEGEVFHRDSLGSAQEIHPGAVNWMTAARGIAHSERTPERVRAGKHRMHILQFWVGLPKEREKDDPQFHGYAAEALPVVSPSGVRVRVCLGSAYGARSPVVTTSPTLLADAQFQGPGELRLPAVPESAAFVIEGTVQCENVTATRGTMLVFSPDAAPLVRSDARPGWRCSAANRSTGRGTSGGTSSPARRRPSSRRRGPGGNGAGPSSPATRRSSCPWQPSRTSPRRRSEPGVI